MSYAELKGSMIAFKRETWGILTPNNAVVGNKVADWFVDR